MNVFRSPVRLATVSLAVALGLVAMVGCAKKVTNVDADYTAPEGQYSADAQMVVYPDLPIVVDTFKDILPDGPDTGDELQSSEERYVARGAMHGMIMDGTAATGYQVLRREANGGYAQLKDYTLNPVSRYFDSHWELYAFTDGAPSSFSPPSYLGRGVLSGAVTASSPLTNVGQVASTTMQQLVYTANTIPTDSLITMSWKAVSGATGYWIQIYQFMGGTGAKLLSAQPAPFVYSDVRNYFVGYVAAPATSYKLGETGATIYFQRGLILKSEYLVRISAVNDQGEMIAFSYGDYAYLRSTGSYLRYRLGAVTVTPTPDE